ncbi:hypothetical protein BDC45DRAFT_531697 [Circinella umbellata]|nr:hypothetical protein BDC45DRAFT_531697 [Circinella umbellata]
MVASDWYEYHENTVDDDERTSDDNSAYQIHQEDDIKEYELPPSANTITNNNLIYTTDTVATIPSEDSSNDTNTTSTQTKFNGSFLARLAAIPLVQDSISNANTIVQQHALGRFAGRTLSTLYSATQTYIPKSVAEQNSRLYTHLEQANALGNKSLDLFEEHFPMLIHATGHDLKHTPHLIKSDICGRIGTAIDRFRAPADIASNDMSRRMSLVIDNVEAVLDEYFPQEPNETTNDKKKNEQEGIEDDLIDPQDGQRLDLDDEEQQENNLYSKSQLIRMYRIANSLSIRIAKRIAIQLNHTNKSTEERGGEEKEEEQNAAAMIKLREWLFTQTQQMVKHLDTYKSQLPEPVQAHIIHPVIHIVQKEYEILRQELDRKDISHVTRARNMLTLSQNRVVMPLLQQSVESMRNHVVSYRSMAQQNRAQVINELSAKVPFLANIAPMSTFASHHFYMNMMNKTTGQQEEKKKMNGVHPPSSSKNDIIENGTSITPAFAAEAC